MTVYVDNMRARFGRMIMCHMAADTEEELLAMADRIGVNRRWLQKPPKASWVHFDISLTKRALAIEAGAVECTAKEMAAYRWHRDKVGKAIPPAEAWPIFQADMDARMANHAKAG